MGDGPRNDEPKEHRLATDDGPEVSARGFPEEVKRWRQQIVDESGWQTVREGVEAKLAHDGTETFVLCRSAERRQKEKAMHERFSMHIEEGLGRLARRIEKARRKLDRSPLERQIGRLFERNSRAAGRYLAILVEDQSLPAGLRLDWSIRPEWEDLSRLSTPHHNYTNV